MDKLTKEKRSWNMKQIRSKNTKPEMILRSLLHKMGFRFRLHRKELPGKPDLVLQKHRTVIFVHGCFWHLHEGCREGRIPSSNTDFWRDKLNKNVERDKSKQLELKRLGWSVVIIWECELKNEEFIRNLLLQHLKSTQ